MQVFQLYHILLFKIYCIAMSVSGRIHACALQTKGTHAAIGYIKLRRKNNTCLPSVYQFCNLNGSKLFGFFLVVNGNYNMDEEYRELLFKISRVRKGKKFTFRFSVLQNLLSSPIPPVPNFYCYNPETTTCFLSQKVHHHSSCCIVAGAI